MLVRLVWTPPKAAFVYPIPPAPRTAVLMPGFHGSDAIHVFPDGWTDDAKGFEPQALAASLPQLESLAGRVSLTHAVIVLRNEWEARLTDADRTLLWKAFRVPAFKQIVDEHGELLAAECEAHEGLHIESSRFAPKDHMVEPRMCPCGRVTPRLISLPRLEVVRRIAAYAG